MDAARGLIQRLLPLLAGPAIGVAVGLKVAARYHDQGKPPPLGGTAGVLITGAGMGLAASGMLLVDELFRGAIATRRESGRSARGLQIARILLYALVYPALFFVFLGALAVLFT